MKTYNELVEENNAMREYIKKVEDWYDDGQKLLNSNSPAYRVDVLAR